MAQRSVVKAYTGYPITESDAGLDATDNHVYLVATHMTGRTSYRLHALTDFTK